MTQENVEMVRLAYERLNSGDVDGFLQLCAMDFEFGDLPALPGAGVRIGHDANRAWLVEMREASKTCVLSRTRWWMRALAASSWCAVW